MESELHVWCKFAQNRFSISDSANENPQNPMSFYIFFYTLDEGQTS